MYEEINLHVGQPLPILGLDFPDVWCAVEALASVLQDQLSSSHDDKKMEDLSQTIANLQRSWAEVTQLKHKISQVQDLTKTHETRFQFLHPILLAAY